MAPSSLESLAVVLIMSTSTPYDRLGLYLHLARAAESRRRPLIRDQFLILAGTCASRLSLPTVAAACRRRVLDHNPRHLVGRWESFRDALGQTDFRQFLGQLLRTYPLEKAEHMLECLGVDPAQERKTYSDEEEYAAALLSTTVAAMRRVAVDPSASLEVDGGPHVLGEEDSGNSDDEEAEHARGKRLLWDDSQVYIVDDAEASVLDTQEIDLNEHDTVDDSPPPQELPPVETRTLPEMPAIEEIPSSLVALGDPEDIEPSMLDDATLLEEGTFSSMSLHRELATSPVSDTPTWTRPARPVSPLALPAETHVEELDDSPQAEASEDLSNQILMFLGVASAVFLAAIFLLIALR